MLMDILGTLAAAVLTKECVVEQRLLEPLSNKQYISRELLPLPHEPMAQITPVYQLDVQATSEQFTTEQNQIRNRVEAMETRVSEIEAQHFSPTAFLEGEVILGFSGVSGRNIDDSVVFQESVELTLNVSFTGEDALEVGLESGNSREFLFVDELTFEGRLGFPSDTDGDSLRDSSASRFELSELSYEFPIGDRSSLYISTTGDDLSDFNPFLGDNDDDDDDNSDGAISEFGSENPIHNLVEDIGLQLNYDLTDDLGISVGYFSAEASNPEPGAGLFNGNQSAFVQLEFEPSDRFLLGFTYVHTYNDSSLETETGSLRSQINLERPVVGNSYGISTFFAPSPRFAIGGWVGLTKATVIDLGNADVWNYAFTLALPDFGKEDNLLGVVIGQEPRLTGTSGFTIDDQRIDPDTSLHIELFYRNQLSDEISVTPGLVWITAPNHDNSNPDILVFTIRTTFKF